MSKELYDKAKHLVVKPGDKLPLTGVDWTIVTSAGEVLKKPLPGHSLLRGGTPPETPTAMTNCSELWACAFRT